MTISLKLLKKMKNYGNINIYFETGMSTGNGIKKAIECNFNKIYSIDICKKWITYNEKQFRDKTNIFLIHDDSQNLDKHINNINEKIFFFLDAHNDHSNSDTENEKCIINCPILKELEIIKNHHIKDHLIIIDDILTTGTSILQSVEEFAFHKLIISAFVVLDREEERTTNDKILENTLDRLDSVFTLEDF